jgi:SAM-dependent methyltransferase
MTDPPTRQALTELFAGQGWPAGAEELLRRGLAPRAPELLLDAPGRLGLGAGQLALGAGCRDATAAIALADGACDLVWCRDVLSCLPDCRCGLRQCARVLRPGGGMVLYAVFAPDRLEPGDRALVVEGLGNTAASMDQATVEAAIAAAGLQLAGRDRIGSEWLEHQLERDPGHLAEDLLELARLTRARDRFEPLVGPVWYRRAVGFALWQLQIALGRLVPVLYLLVKPAPA